MFVFIGLLVGAFWLGILHGSPIIGGVLGGLCGWVYQLMSRIKKLETSQQSLSQQLQTMLQQRNDDEAAVDTAVQPLPEQAHPQQAESDIPLTAVQPPAAAQSALTLNDPVISTVSETEGAPAVIQTQSDQTSPDRETPQAITSLDSTEPLVESNEPDIFSRGFAAAKDWLFGGNPFVRAGIVLLFIGFVFLMRYSLEKNLIPVELRLLGSAAVALALLGFGWKFRHRAGAYGLILQAGGVGLLYLTVFAAFSLYQLLPSLLAFALLVLIVAAAVGLAVLQNSLPLAMFATAGGFLAPILVSSGNNNYVGLFSFYALLNLGIVGIAWFKSWRLLNLLGFAFTFAIAAMWGWSSYQPANFSTVEPFLILFFLFYVAIAILFALRTPVNFKDKVDSTLLFGTPILGFGLQVALVQDFAYGIAISAVVLGGFYLLLAAVMWKRFAKTQKLLCETFVVLGVIFTTLAIPFAVDGAMTAAAWAIEGAGVLWISIRQRQWIRRGVGVLLQYGALVSLVVAVLPHFLFLPFQSFTQVTPFINGQFIAGVLVSAAMLLSSWLLGAEFSSKRSYERALSLVLLLTGLVFLTLCFEVQVLRAGVSQYFIMLHLIYAALFSMALLVAVRLTDWPSLKYALPLSLVLMGLAFWGLLYEESSLSVQYGWLLWPLSFAVYYAVLFLYQQKQRFGHWLTVLQVITAWLLLMLLNHELYQQVGEHLDYLSGWYVAALPLVSIASIWLIMKGEFWPLRDYRDVLLRYVVLPLAGLLFFWALYSIRSSGEIEPMFWLPLLNPLDVVIMLWGLT
ncbi:MAG: DUF2339 domain-containing protein, partial [Thiolinea sp.]